MTIPGLTGNELMAWVERTSSGWRELLMAHPEALSFSCDIRETTSVAELLQHIVAVELRYAERLAGVPETPYEAVPFGSVAAIYGTHGKAMELLGQLEHQDLATLLQPAWNFARLADGQPAHDSGETGTDLTL